MQKKQKSVSTNKNVDCLHVLRRHQLFGKLAPSHLKRLCALAGVRKVSAGTMIYAHGDTATAMFGVCAGAITLTIADASGGMRAELIEAGRLFGESALFGGGRRIAAAVTAADCELMVIKRYDFHAALLADPKLALKLVEVLGAQLRVARRSVEEAASLTVPTRIARTLLHLADEAGIESGRLSFTQHELARTVQSSRESVNKCLRSWMRRKLIRLERGGTTLIDRAALGAIARGIDGASKGQDARRPIRRLLSM
jgi:CRP-like cAMP-binding protein